MTTIVATFKVPQRSLDYVQRLLGNIAREAGIEPPEVKIQEPRFSPGATPQAFATFPPGRKAKINWYRQEGFSERVSDILTATGANPDIFFTADMKTFTWRNIGDIVKNAITAWQDWRRSQETN